MAVYYISKSGSINELYHYGVKGMKWGVRRTREEIDASKNRIVKKIITGHSATPKIAEPNAVYDHVSKYGSIDVRTFYSDSGKKAYDIHTTNHGYPKTHNYGTNGEHVVMYEWNEDGSLKNKTRRELTDSERKENADIL